MHDLIARAYAALSSIHPLAPWLALTAAIFLPQYAVRKWRPMWWERFALLGPEAALASKVWQGLPSVLLGALWAAFASGGDLRAAFYGGLAGALAPLKHEALKRLPNSVVPYVGGSYPAASTAPRKAPSVPPLSLIACLLAALVTSAFLAGCSSAQHPAGCGPADQAALDAWYQAQLVQHCSAYVPIKSAEQCPHFERITADYQRRNEELYLRCHP